MKIFILFTAVQIYKKKNRLCTFHHHVPRVLLRLEYNVIREVVQQYLFFYYICSARARYYLCYDDDDADG